jgi:N-acetylneuraminic acid mutarotase
MRFLLCTFLYLTFYSAAAQWTVETRAALPAEDRDDAVAAVVGESLYTGSGLTAGFYNTNDWWRYTYTTDSWEQLPNMPFPPRQYLKSFTYQHCLYLFGGYQNEANTYNDLWRYNTLNGRWTQLDSLPGNRRWGSFVFALGDYAYVGGGKDTLHYLSDFYRYHIPTNRWERLPDLPFGARGHGIAAANNESVFVGLGANDSTNTHADIWKFDGRTETFTKLTDLDSALWRAGAARMLSDSGQWDLYIWGGERADQRYSHQLYRVDEYNGSFSKTPMHFGAANRGVSMLPYRKGAALLFGVNSQIQRQASFHYLEPEQLPTKRPLQVYPNPIAQNERLVVRSIAQLTGVEVYSMSGQQVFVAEMAYPGSTLLLQLPPLREGLYVLRATSPAGTQQQLLLVQ